MKAAKTWCVAGLVVLAAFSLQSCGKDEANGNGSGGTGMVVTTGGSAGSGGVGGGRTGGTGGMGGSAGTSADVGTTKLGRGCIDDADCADTKAPGLTCVTATDTVLGDGAPPKGLCTAECTSDAECDALGTGSLCYPFVDGANSGYCVEGCKLGEELAPSKCHNRPEFACTFAGVIDTGDPCTDTIADCQVGEICGSADTCLIVVPACLPSCRGDIDCAAGLHCDQSFLNGMCVEAEQVGKGLGAPCTVPGPNDPDEPDDCLGYCQADTVGSTTGHCSVTCSVGHECAFNTETKKYDGACIFGSIINRSDIGTGDFGFCDPTCNCTDECQDPTLLCTTDGGELPATFRGPGLCFTQNEPPEAPFPEYNQCVGAGGADSGGSGGSGGEAGAASGEGGAGAAP